MSRTSWVMLGGAVLQLALAAGVHAQGDTTVTVTKDYVRRAKDRELLTKGNIPAVAALTERSSDRGFALFWRYADRINQIMDSAGYAERLIDAVITKEEVVPHLRVSEPLPDWDAIARAIAQKYTAAAAERIVAAAKAQQWADLQQLYVPKLDVGALNNKAWFEVFLRSHDPAELAAAIAWMERVVQQIEKDPVEGFIAATITDTYANLLYKAGRVDEAIAWEEKAMAVEPDPAGREAFRQVLDKMKRGEPTWPQP